MLISETINVFRDYLRGSKSEYTVKNYIVSLKMFLHNVGDKSVSEITYADFIRHKAFLVGKKYSSSSISMHLSALSGYIAFLQKVHRIKSMDVIPDDVKALRPRTAQTIPQYLESWEVSSLIDACVDIEEKIIVKLLFHTGLRANEMLNMALGSIKEDPDGTMWLKVRGKRDKERVIPLNDDIKNTVKQYIAFASLKRDSKLAHDSRLFSYSYSTLWYKLKKIAKRANISAHPHLMRHTFATSLLSKGVDIRVISELMGHANISSTARYAKVKPYIAKEAVNKLAKKEYIEEYGKGSIT